MNKIYLVINDYSNDSGLYIQEIKAFKNYDDAKKQFIDNKELIKSFDTQYNVVEDKEDYYCEYEEGNYAFYHELVYIKELEVK
jgi:hypothetical protein